MGGATRTLFPFAKPSIRTDDIGTARFPKDKSDRGELIEEEVDASTTRELQGLCYIIRSCTSFAAAISHGHYFRV